MGEFIKPPRGKAIGKRGDVASLQAITLLSNHFRARKPAYSGAR